MYSRGDLPGDEVSEFAYDGPGRLTYRTQPPDGSEYYETLYYCDGVRIIQQAYHAWMESTPVGGGLLESMELLLGFQESYEEMDFIWGPDYVDELAFLINKNSYIRYALLDANYNVMAYARPTGQVAGQFTYGPYGDVAAADGIAKIPVGHQGLFFFRFDGSAGDTALAPDAKGLYYNRNRWLSPELGRFTSRDVNETALPIVTAILFNAESWSILLSSFSGEGLYGDGANLYEYQGSNPLSMLDPAGTSYLNTLGAMGVQGILGGIFNRAFGGDFVSGAIGGALGGAAGGLLNCAFAASLSGLYGTLTAHMITGGVDGAVGAFGETFYSTHDFGAALSEALWGAAIGAATGGVADFAGRSRFARRLSINFKKLMKKFKHAGDFGIMGPNNGENRALFAQAIEDHVLNYWGRPGEWGAQKVMFHLDQKTGKLVITDMAGNFLDAFRATTKQIDSILERGFLWGGTRASNL